MNSAIKEQTEIISRPNIELIERSKIKKKIARAIVHFFYEDKYDKLLRTSNIPIPKKNAQFRSWYSGPTAAKVGTGP